MIFSRIKKHLGKEDYQLVTIQKFAKYLDLNIELIKSVIFNYPFDLQEVVSTDLIKNIPNYPVTKSLNVPRI